MRVTFLGTGTSRGIPVIGCQCRVCASTNPKNRRLRPSVLVQSEATVIIDTSVDFRIQMLQYDVRRLDAVLYTHAHVDHILGLDDVYPFNVRSGKAMPVYASPQTLRELRITFRYLFEEKLYPGIPKVELFGINGAFQIGDLRFEPIEVFHGKMPVLGFRVDRFAYVTDVNFIPDESLEKLRGVEYLVLDGLRFRAHPTHFTLAEAAATAQRIGARQTYLVHMCHDVDHEEGNASLPESVQLAYDGMTLET